MATVTVTIPDTGPAQQALIAFSGIPNGTLAQAITSILEQAIYGQILATYQDSAPPFVPVGITAVVAVSPPPA